MSSTLMFTTVFGAVALAVIGLYSLLVDLLGRDRTRLQQRLSDEFRRQQREQTSQSSLFKNLSQYTPESYGEMKLSPAQRLETLLQQSGLDMSVAKLLAISAALGVLLAAPALLLGHGVLLTGLAVLVGLAAPVLYVYYKKAQRRAKLLSQLPDAFDLMARVVRAGQTLSQGMLAVAEEFEQPISGEFSCCYEQMNLGLSPEVALRDLARRTDILEVKIFVLAVLIQQLSGGNLAELLDNLAGVVRDRFRVQSRIHVLTSEGRFSANVLLALPWVLFAVILLVNEDYGRMLFEMPAVLVIMFIMEALGALWIYKVVHFDY